MCVILVAPNVSEIKKLSIESAWKRNADGAGYAYRERSGAVRYHKGIMKLKKLMEHLDNIPEHNSFVLHMRVATHGAVIPIFTHPFQVDNDLVLFHNGVLSEFGKRGDGGYSDTAHLSHILSCVDEDDRHPLLKALCGYGNKFVLMDSKTTMMYGGFQETSVDGVKASNLFWEDYSSKSYSKKTYSHGKWRHVEPWSEEDNKINSKFYEENEWDSKLYRYVPKKKGVDNKILLPAAVIPPDIDDEMEAMAERLMESELGVVSIPIAGGDKVPVVNKDAPLAAGKLIVDEKDRAILNGFCETRKTKDSV